MALAAITNGPRDLDVRDVEPVDPEPGEALVAPLAVGLCGTDLHVYDGSFDAPYPVVQGHEVAATITELPDGYVGSLRPGELVALEPVTSCGTCYACRHGAVNTCENIVALGLQRPGGLQQRLTVPVDRCHPVGDLDPRTAVLCETLSVSQHAVGRASTSVDEHVVVLGAGPIGLGAVVAATDVGAKVLVLDLQEQRRQLAQELGAEVAVSDLRDLVDAVDAWTDGDGAAVVVEATGAPTVARAAFHVVATAGRIALVGVSEEQLAVSLRVFTRKELTVVGSRATRDFPAAVDLVRRRRDDVARLVSHIYSLEDTEEALRFALEHPDDAVKVVVEIG